MHIKIIITKCQMQGGLLNNRQKILSLPSVNLYQSFKSCYRRKFCHSSILNARNAPHMYFFVQIQGIQMMLRLSTVYSQMGDLCKNAVLEFSRDLALNEEYQKFTKFRISDKKEQKLNVIKKGKNNQESREMSPFQKIRGRKNREIKPQPPKSQLTLSWPESLNVSGQQKIIIQESKESKNQQKPRRSQRPQRGTRRQVPIIEQKKQKLSKETSEKAQKIEKKQAQAPKVHNNRIQVSKKSQLKSLAEANPLNGLQPRSKTKEPILLQKNENKQPLGKRVNRANKKQNIVLSLSESEPSSQPSDYKSRRASIQRRKPSEGKSKRGGSRRKPKRVLKQGQVSRKRPINGFMRFFQQVKDEIKKNNKINRLPDLSHLISIEWNKLSKKQQEKYNDAYYSEVQKLKEEEKQSRRSQEQRKQQDKVKKDEQNDEYESIREEQASGKEQQDNEDERSDNESGSSSHDGEEQEEQENSPQNKPRQILKVKRPVPQKSKYQVNQQEQSGSISEQFSISDQNEESSSSGQQNSESSSDQVNHAKQSKSNRKTQNHGKSSNKKKQ